DVVRETSAIKREVGYMTQRFSLWEDLTIRENLEFVARMYGMPDRRQAVTAALQDLGLDTRQDQLAGTLSGGWKQRLSLAAGKLAELSGKLRGRAGVAHVTAFGNTLHVTGENEAELDSAIAEFRSDAELHWRRSHAGLEDVFLHLMRDAQDNIQ